MEMVASRVLLLPTNMMVWYNMVVVWYYHMVPVTWHLVWLLEVRCA